MQPLALSLAPLCFRANELASGPAPSIATTYHGVSHPAPTQPLHTGQLRFCTNEDPTSSPIPMLSGTVSTPSQSNGVDDSLDTIDHQGRFDGCGEGDTLVS